MDRRVRRTKRLLRQAMLDLIDEVGYDRVTIGALTDRADVGRSTFYSHYQSKEDLLFDSFEGWVATVGMPTADTRANPARGSGASTDGDHFRFALPLLHHIAAQRRFFEATIVRSRSARIRRRVTRMLVARVRSELERLGRSADAVAAHAVAGAFLEVATWWLEEGLRTPVEEVDAAFQRAMLLG